MNTPWLKLDVAGDAWLSLRIQPNAKRTEFVGLHGEAMKLRLAAPPVDGKANAALCAFIADFCGCPKSAVSVVSGAASRAKRLRVAGIGADAARRLQELAR